MNDSNMEFSGIESKRFGYKVYRHISENFDDTLLDSLDEVLGQGKGDVVILRIPSECMRDIEKIKRKGFFPIVGDTLVHYELDLDKKNATNAPQLSSIEIRLEHESNALALSALVESCFRSHINHYHANPLFSPEDILAGYVEWSLSFLGGYPVKELWGVYWEGQLAGYFTLAFENRQVNFILVGIHPMFQGKGIFREVVRFIIQHARGRGMHRLVTSTQTHAISAQRAYTENKLKIYKSQCTVHVLQKSPYPSS